MQRRCASSWMAALVAAALVLGAPAGAAASRCKSKNGGGKHCGLDAAAGGGGCTEASIQNLPLKCAPGQTMVIYDLGRPFPADPTALSHAVLRASPNSPCAGMTDLPVPLTGYAVGCWSPPDQNGCRVVEFLNGGSICLHIQDQKLGAACGTACQDVSTEQVAVSNAGAAEHFVCPPTDPSASCRATRSDGTEGFRLWVGGFCSTNGCSDPGTGPTIGPDTCVAQWGATYFGYAIGKSAALGPGWYDWASGAFKVDYRNGKATCEKLGACLGEGHANPWDLSLVGVPRASTPPPCLGGSRSCNAAGCVP